MARSSTVWVVISDLYPWPAATFTVKHELKTWLGSKNEGQLERLRLWRCPDGGGVLNVGGNDYFHSKQTPRPVELDISEVLK